MDTMLLSLQKKKKKNLVPSSIRHICQISIKNDPYSEFQKGNDKRELEGKEQE